MIRSLIALAAVLTLGAALAGCGKQGDLERPAPLWGAKAKAEYEAQQRQAAEARNQAQADNQIEPLPDEGANAGAGPPP
jgi:predicted small lipoprotein YifL